MKTNQKRSIIQREDIKWEYDIVYVRAYAYVEPFKESLENLKKEVNKYCQKGWIPEGNASMIQMRDGQYLCQTIIRPIETSNSEPVGTKVL